jgi:NAD(P)-dependent dehydrogenase (short-subunit alcohol dehydrogenase family)
MKQRIALVTGANRGIGFEISRQLAEKGWLVYLAARELKRGAEAAAQLQKSAYKVRAIQLDVSDPKSIEQAARELTSQIDHLDVLVNNAGVYEDGPATPLNVSPEVVNKTFQTNTLGPLLISQHLVPLLAKSDSGRIVNISSGMGALGDMGDAAPAYSISKAALNAVTRQLSAALQSKNISVNSVCPGWVRTNMGGASAPRTPAEGADTTVWLATEAPQNVTGQFLRDRKPIAW